MVASLFDTEWKCRRRFTDARLIHRAPTRSVTGMPSSILAEIRRGALVALHGGRAVVIGEGAGHRTGAVIVQVADLVGQGIDAPVAVLVAGFGQSGRND